MTKPVTEHNNDKDPAAVVNPAASGGKPMVVYVFSPTCKHCQQVNGFLGSDTFAKANHAQNLPVHKFSTGNAAVWEWLDKAGPNGAEVELKGVPAFLLVDGKGEVIGKKEGSFINATSGVNDKKYNASALAGYGALQADFKAQLQTNAAKAADKVPVPGECKVAPGAELPAGSVLDQLKQHTPPKDKAACAVGR